MLIGDLGDDFSESVLAGVEDDGQLDHSDALLGDPGTPDPEQGAVDAPDRYRSATSFGTTDSEERIGRSLTARLREEEPDALTGADWRSDREGVSVVDEQSEDYDAEREDPFLPQDLLPGVLVAGDGGLGPDLDQQQVAARADDDSARAAEDSAIHYDRQR